MVWFLWGFREDCLSPKGEFRSATKIMLFLGNPQGAYIAAPSFDSVFLGVQENECQSRRATIMKNNRFTHNHWFRNNERNHSRH
jgi:hypothetical protein